MMRKAGMQDLRPGFLLPYLVDGSRAGACVQRFSACIS